MNLRTSVVNLLYAFFFSLVLCAHRLRQHFESTNEVHVSNNATSLPWNKTMFILIGLFHSIYASHFPSLERIISQFAKHRALLWQPQKENCALNFPLAFPNGVGCTFCATAMYSVLLQRIAIQKLFVVINMNKKKIKTFAFIATCLVSRQSFTAFDLVEFAHCERCTRCKRTRSYVINEGVHPFNWQKENIN